MQISCEGVCNDCYNLEPSVWIGKYSQLEAENKRYREVFLWLKEKLRKQRTNPNWLLPGGSFNYSLELIIEQALKGGE